MFFLAATACSYFFFEGLNLQLNPQRKAKKIFVTASYPNALPSAVELKVTTPLEAGLSRIGGIERIYSRSNIGQAEIELDVAEDINLDYLRFEVASRVREIYPSLPPATKFPDIKLSGLEENTNTSLLTYSLFSSLSADKISRYASDQLIPLLSLVEGVKEIRLEGSEESEWVIEYNVDKMLASNITKEDIRAAVNTYGLDESLSEVNYNEDIISLKLGQAQQSSLSHMLVKSDSIFNYYLDDVATVFRKPKERKSIYRINGRSNVRIQCIPEKNANHLVTAGLLKDKIEDAREKLPPGYDLLLENDQTEYLREELRKIRLRSLLSLSLLLLFVIIIYRKLSYTIIIITSLLVNLGLAVIAYNVMDVNINLYALAAITISFGILIDNALVILHHIRHYQNLSIFPALISATLTTIASLIVIFFLPELWRENLEEFARVIMINLSISLLVSFLFVPALQYRWERREEQQALVENKNLKAFSFWESLFSKIKQYRRWVIVASIWAFGLPVFLIPSEIEGLSWYNHTIGSETYQEDIKPWVEKILGGSFRFFYRYVYERGSFRNNEETILYANVRLPDGSTLEQLDQLCAMVESYLSQYLPHQVKNYILNISNGERASFRITFVDQNDYYFPFVLKNRLTSMAVNLGGATWNIYGVGKGFSNGSFSRPPQFSVKMRGYNLPELRTISSAFAELLESHPRIKEVDTDGNLDWYSREKYAFHFDYDKRAMIASGFELGDLYGVIQNVNPLREFVGYSSENVPIRMISDNSMLKGFWNLNNEVISKDSSQLSLSGISSVERLKLPSSLHKENQQYLLLLKWEYTGSARFGYKYLDECIEKFRPTLPLGYELEKLQNRFFQEEAKKQYGLLGLVIVLIFMICAVHFESFRTAISIVLMIPISFIGIFLTFYLFDFTFDQGGYTSFILVSGITVNSMILIWSDYNRLSVKHGRSVAIYTKAFSGKITPILLTIFSTILGLTPFLMFGDQEPFWFSLAVGAMGGLFFSVFAVCLIMPAFVKFSRS
nr:efflux RND transporter permease subunit [Portibacter lacus]